MNETMLLLESPTADDLNAEARRLTQREKLSRRVGQQPADHRTAIEAANLQMDLGDSNPGDLFGHAAVQRRVEAKSEKPNNPMTRQWQRIKAQLPPDTLLFFRVGDFYELFYVDAQRAAPILGIALTSRGAMPLCGVPYRALDAYLAKAIRANRRVAICEGTDEFANSMKKQREINRIVTS